MIDEVSLPVDALAAWQMNQKADFKKMMKAMRMLGAFGRNLRNEDMVQKCANPTHGDVYEMRADKGKARMMFFFDETEGLTAICTNGFWKGGNQDTAFKHCAYFKSEYLKSQKQRKK